VTATPAGGNVLTAWPEVVERVASVASTPGRLLVVADYDGTLAEFDPHPMGAQPAPGVRALLRRLIRASVVDPGRVTVAVLSGRAALDVATRVRVGGVRYLGNHGNEGGELGRGHRAERLAVELNDGLAVFTPAAERLAVGLAREAGSPDWLFVEPKGPAVAFHWRQAPDREAARARLYEAIERVEAQGLTADFGRIDSRLIVEFQPRGAGAKGEAVERLVRDLSPSAAIVLGDDAPDAEAFRTIGRAVVEGRLAAGLSVAVEHGRPLHADVVESADVVVAGTRGAAGVLRVVARTLERSA
jgi:trehalose 6-phosphate phosphatase